MPRNILYVYFIYEKIMLVYIQF